jgi:hypothetical protein
MDNGGRWLSLLWVVDALLWRLSSVNSAYEKWTGVSMYELC